jgi:2-polyprenyl-3-methyl-5-hydroxy-6-metoxy-1,4-benzoquinol methylase
MKVRSPITKSSNIKLIKTTNSNIIINNWQNELDIDISKELEGISEISEFLCLDTGLKFFLPLECEGSSDLYVRLQKHKWYYNLEKWEHNAALKWIQKESKLYEIGCGDGMFLEKCIKRGIKGEGNEFNEVALNIAKEKGLIVHCQDISKISFHEIEPYDVVCAFQVLEHVSKPVEFLRTCLKLLKPNGRLIIAVPNSDSFLSTEENILDMPPHHLTRWNLQAFKSLQKELPISVKSIHYEPLANYHIEWFITIFKKKFPNLLRLPYFEIIFKGALTKGLRKLLRGHTMMVVIEKRW